MIMAMSLSEMTVEARALLNDPGAALYSDTEIENWLSLGAQDVSAKSLGVLQAVVLVEEPFFNILDDATLSGTPRVLDCSSYYLKVYPTRDGGGGTQTPSAWKTYDDTTLSGTPVVYSFMHGSNFYFFKGYPTAGALNNPTGDEARDTFENIAIEDTSISGTPVVVELTSNATSYFFKAYPLINSSTWEMIKPIAVQANKQGLVRIHPKLLGRLNVTEPTAYYDFAHSIATYPSVDENDDIRAIIARWTDDPESLPDDLQPDCITFAVMMGKYKTSKFGSAALLYKKYVETVMYKRKRLYTLNRDLLNNFVIPDRTVIST